MSIADKDLLGNPLTDLERSIAEVHEALENIARQDDLPPCVAAGMAHALSCTWQVLNDLDVPCAQPEDVA